jgi:1,4-dihydroxy-2-naphthoate octaprenyltransferase
MSDPTPSRARVWLDACRPRTLPAAAAPVILGAAVAAHAGGFRALPALAALVGALLIQVGTNFANDVFDAEKGADTPDRLGPVRAVAAGLVDARAMRLAMGAAFAAAALVGVYLVLVGGWGIVLIGVASIAAGILYTGGPWPLGYHGLGDLFVFVFFGLVAVSGTVWVQMHALPPLVWVVASGAGALSTAILVVNNLRDRTTDVRAGKRTLAVRFGRRFAELEYAALLVAALACAPLLAALSGSLWPLLPLLSGPQAIALWRSLRRDEGRALNPLLGRTAGLLLVWSVLVAAGLLLARP